MPAKIVEFRFYTGLKRQIFRNPRLSGSWDANGRYSDQWPESPMQEDIGDDGCPTFRGSVSLDLADSGKTFQWGVILDGPSGKNFMGDPDRDSRSELHRAASHFPTRTRRWESDGALFPDSLPPSRGQQASPCGKCCTRPCIRRLGAQCNSVPKWSSARIAATLPTTVPASIRRMPVVPLSLASDGIWEGAPPGGFDQFMSLPYMYRIKNAQGKTVYRTDIFSRSQIGKGRHRSRQIGVAGHGGNPGRRRELQHCHRSRRDSRYLPVHSAWGTAESHSRGGFLGQRIHPRSAGALTDWKTSISTNCTWAHSGLANPEREIWRMPLQFLDHLVELGINTVELLPLAEFGGTAGWGYGNSHHFCIESSAGGRDKYRHFVRECHRRGIAVIQDVVYNHYEDGRVDRAEKFFDSTAPEQDIYYWYEGRTTDYSFADGGYLNNGSSGRTPRFWEDNVRQQFISGAAFLLEEMHVDGFRVDLDPGYSSR